MAPHRSPRLDKKSLSREHKVLYEEVLRILSESDPIHLLRAGAPADEYELEVGTILPRLREAHSARDVKAIVHEEFSRWFSAEVAGPASVYGTIADGIWLACQRKTAAT